MFKKNNGCVSQGFWLQATETKSCEFMQKMNLLKDIGQFTGSPGGLETQV